MNNVKRYVLRDPTDGHDILGGPVGELNHMIVMSSGAKRPCDMAVGEAVKRTYSVPSGARQHQRNAYYMLLRIEDGDTTEI